MVGLLILAAVDEVIFSYFLNFLVEGEQLFFGRFGVILKDLESK